MSGFNDDIVSILKHNNLLHEKAIGLISGTTHSQDASNLFLHLLRLGMRVSGKRENTKWDYIFIPGVIVSTRVVLMALSEINAGGIVILEITEKQNKYEKYLRVGENISATKVKYEDRYYLILHQGDDYGN